MERRLYPPPPPSTPERAPWEEIPQLREDIALLIERFDRLIELIGAIAPAVPGVPGVPAVEVTALAPWVAKEPEQIFSKAILSADTYYSDKMVNWTKGKRILFKVESSLNKAVTIQLIGNIVDDMNLATDINGALPCAANGNISVGLAFDDWHPYVGVKIDVGADPTAGILTISAVVQE